MVRRTSCSNSVWATPGTDVELVEQCVVVLRHDPGRTNPPPRSERHARANPPHGSGRGAKARHATLRARPSRDRQSPMTRRPTRRAGPLCRQRGARVCTCRFPLGGQSDHSHACRARPRGTRPPQGLRIDGARSNRTQESRDRGQPGAPRPARPPCSATCIRMPFVSTMQCFISVIVVSPQRLAPC
jgi:hypothetical protein